MQTINSRAFAICGYDMSRVSTPANISLQASTLSVARGPARCTSRASLLSEDSNKLKRNITDSMGEGMRVLSHLYRTPIAMKRFSRCSSLQLRGGSCIRRSMRAASTSAETSSAPSLGAASACRKAWKLFVRIASARKIQKLVNVPLHFHLGMSIHLSSASLLSQKS